MKYSIRKPQLKYTMLFAIGGGLALLFSSCSRQFMVLNKGVSGNNSSDLVRRLPKDVLLEKPDLLIVLVGTNDMVNPVKMTSDSLFEKNLKHIAAEAAHENIPMVLMSPPLVDEMSLFERHDRSLFKTAPNARLKRADSLIHAVAATYKLRFIDLQAAFNDRQSPSREVGSLIVNKKNFGKDDGVHPTIPGYHFIAEKIYAELKREHMIKRKMKVVCFGDSITFGAFMAGAGTSDGQNYPSFLKQLLTGNRIAESTGTVKN